MQGESGVGERAALPNRIFPSQQTLATRLPDAVAVEGDEEHARVLVVILLDAVA